MNWSEIMDQALKSALEKYNGKLGLATSQRPTMISKIFLGVAICIGLVLVFSVFVKYDFLGAENVWSEIKDISVGEQTIGSIINNLSEDFSVAISQNNKNMQA